MLLFAWAVCLVTIPITRASYECKRCHELQDVEFARNISTLNDMESFFALAGINPTQREFDYLINSARSGLDRPPFARCEPELKSVPIFEDDELKSSMVVPSCVRIKRCGGCCYHHALTCTPTSSVTRQFMVMAMNGNFGNTVINVSMVEHLHCECRCRQSAPCKANSIWNEKKCSCECSHTDDMEKCERDLEKFWNKNTCKCECKNSEAKKRFCNGQFFNENTCRCENRYGFNKRPDMPEEVDSEIYSSRPNSCNKQCGGSHVLNTDKCICECPKPLKTCPSGFRINLNTCECRENAARSILASSKMWNIRQDNDKS